MSTTSNVILF